MRWANTSAVRPPPWSPQWCARSAKHSARSRRTKPSPKQPVRRLPSQVQPSQRLLPRRKVHLPRPRKHPLLKPRLLQLRPSLSPPHPLQRRQQRRLPKPPLRRMHQPPRRPSPGPCPDQSLLRPNQQLVLQPLRLAPAHPAPASPQPSNAAKVVPDRRLVQPRHVPADRHLALPSVRVVPARATIPSPRHREWEPSNAAPAVLRVVPQHPVKRVVTEPPVSACRAPVAVHPACPAPTRR